MDIKTQIDLLNNLTKIKQSLWLDYISRDILLSNKLSELIINYKITGLTSNPTIFEQSLKSSNLYDESIKIQLPQGISIDDIAQSLMIEDIQRGCDIFREIYETSNKNDGYVSIELPPNIKGVQNIIEQSQNLYTKIGRENLMIKIVADEEGIEAMYELIKRGINVNMTLIFSPQIYRKVIEKYIQAIEWRDKMGFSENVFSVASFFVSRIDTYMDRKLEELSTLKENEKIKSEILSLRGKTAISVALIIYSIYQDLLLNKFKKYRDKGFKFQKLLWASTSTKNPSYRDTLYVDELCLKDTINTVPLKTLFSFFEHGSINTKDIEERINEAKKHINSLMSFGISVEKMYEELLRDGIKRFLQSYENILKIIEQKTKSFDQTRVIAKIYNVDIGWCEKKLEESNFIDELFNKNPKLWKKEKEDIEVIKNSLGWVDIPFYMKEKINEINNFRDEVLRDGIRYVVILGMGGSSLAPEVIRSVFEKNSYLKMFVLDTTNPDWINDVRSKIEIEKTLFIFASKSGTTVEPNSQFKLFYNLCKKKNKNPSQFFVAITDKNTPLQDLAKKYKFRKIFINPSDIGGRFSALSYFGLVPASLIGVDIGKFLDLAIRTIEEIKYTKTTCAKALGCFLTQNYLNGKDKLIVILPKKFERLGLWIEQLIAESTGKEQKGIVPVIETELTNYDETTDKMFVSIELAKFISPKHRERINQLILSKQPLIRIYIDDIYEISKLFYIWEIATAIAGYFMKINPFNQPDVVSTKEITKKILKDSKSIDLKPLLKIGTTKVYVGNIKIENKIRKYDDILWELLKLSEDNSYYSIMAFFHENKVNDELLTKLSQIIKELTGCVVIKSYGPRYLHSTGQLFKGGSNNGIFIILTTKSKKDIKVSGEDYSFEELSNAQAKADFISLCNNQRKVVMLHFSRSNHELELKKMIRALKKFLVNKEDEMPKTQLRKNKNTNTKTDYIVIDYPKHLETITSKHYTIRIGASECKNVEVSIDGGAWQNARYSVGYWWYDWNNIPPGNHEIIAKLIRNDGTYLVSKRRRCKAV